MTSATLSTVGLTAVLALTSLQSCAEPDELVLAEKHISAYRIVIGRTASPSEKHAADELQHFLKEISGAELPIGADDTPPMAHEIILGDNARLRRIEIAIDFPSLGDEGYVIKTSGSNLIIAGGAKRGTLYGVYGFLEDHLGCRWFTSQISHIPKKDRLAVTPIDERQIPALEYREVLYQDAMDGDWAARNRLNSANAHLTEAQGGKICYFPFVHSFWQLIPPDEYFKSNTEWFSLIDGKRDLVGHFKRTQLCLTNEEMIQQAIRTVRQWIHDHPEANIISISQNDGPGGWCECDNCHALEVKEGGVHSAPVIYFVNRIAEAVAKEHPTIAIDTLAYSYTIEAPKTLKPLPNVIVRLCTGACDSHPIGDEACDRNAALRRAFEDWSRLTKRIYVWDYIVNFHQYLLPFPNLHAVGPNLQFFVKHGVRGVFEQGSGDVSHSDMAPLKAFLLAKLLWTPDYNRDKAVHEFLDAYYGPAAEPIGQYLALLETEVKNGAYMWFHMSPFERGNLPTYLGVETAGKASHLFDEAEHRVDGNPELLLRVQVARLSLDYVRLSLAARVSAMAGHGKDVQPLRQWYKSAIDNFFKTANRGGVQCIRESSRHESSMAQFRKLLEAGGEIEHDATLEQ